MGGQEMHYLVGAKVSLHPAAVNLTSIVLSRTVEVES